MQSQITHRAASAGAEVLFHARLRELRAQHLCWSVGQSGMRAFRCWGSDGSRALDALLPAGHPSGDDMALLAMEAMALEDGRLEEVYPGESRVMSMALEIFGCLAPERTA